MSATTSLEEGVVTPVRRRRRNIAAELAAERNAWKSQTLAAGLRCDRCGDAASVFVDERGHCSDCFLLYSVHNVEPEIALRRMYIGEAADSLRPECGLDTDWGTPTALC